MFHCDRDYDSWCTVTVTMTVTVTTTHFVLWPCLWLMFLYHRHLLSFRCLIKFRWPWPWPWPWPTWGVWQVPTWCVFNLKAKTMTSKWRVSNGAVCRRNKIPTRWRSQESVQTIRVSVLTHNVYPKSIPSHRLYVLINYQKSKWWEQVVIIWLVASDDCCHWHCDCHGHGILMAGHSDDDGYYHCHVLRDCVQTQGCA